VCALLTLGPVIWTVSTSLRTPAESFDLPPKIIPTSPTVESYRGVFDQIDVWLLALNSTLVTALIAVGQMITAGLAGYAFARLEFRFKKPLFALVLATMMVPLQVTIVPVFLVLKSMSLTDTLLGLIIPAFPTAFGTFLMRQYFLGMPKDLGEAAMMDGCGALADLPLGVRATGRARPRHRGSARLQLPLERVLPPADPGGLRPRTSRCRSASSRSRAISAPAPSRSSSRVSCFP
jgi:ABC-type glycerol-3-phosphate transport system permease component